MDWLRPEQTSMGLNILDLTVPDCMHASSRHDFIQMDFTPHATM